MLNNFGLVTFVLFCLLGRTVIERASTIKRFWNYLSFFVIIITSHTCQTCAGACARARVCIVCLCGLILDFFEHLSA